MELRKTNEPRCFDVQRLHKTIDGDFSGGIEE